VIDIDARPRLARGVKLGYDPVRRSHVLLFPEGVLLLNATAAAVLEPCDGNLTIAEIITALGGTYCGVRDTDVVAIMARFVGRRVIEVDGRR
jgi:pyrroloquinoline quinone biosynthesis protein D